MTKADLLGVPAAVESFNGFYTQRGPFLMIDSVRVLIAQGIALLAVLVGLIVAVIALVRHRRAARGQAATAVPPPPRTV
jgi:hypothetical protein